MNTSNEGLQMYKELYERAIERICSLEKRLAQEEYINMRYRTWFTYHRTWVAHHNRMIKYDPEYGRAMRRGGKDPNIDTEMILVRRDDRKILDEIG